MRLIDIPKSAIFWRRDIIHLVKYLGLNPSESLLKSMKLKGAIADYHIDLVTGTIKVKPYQTEECLQKHKDDPFWTYYRPSDLLDR